MRNLIFSFFATTLFSTMLAAQDWQTNLAKSKELALNEKKTLILVFQGSDWCAPCIKLDKEVWSTEEFKKYARSHYVMLKADFPRKKKNQLPEEQSKANKKLAELYNQQGIFPLVVILNSSGKVLGQTSYKKMSASEYIKHLESFKS